MKMVAEKMSVKQAKSPPRPRVQLPLSDVQEEFRAQLKLLKKSCDAYDDGDSDEYRRIAIAVRILLYDQGQSRSIATQLGLKSIQFLAYSMVVRPRNLGTSWTLVMMQLNQGDASYLPNLDRLPLPPRLLSFENWWDEEVFRSPGRVTMARSGFILHTANQAGGAHVDPALDEAFYRIAKENEAGWIGNFGGVEKPMIDLEKACVRQIGFEVLQTLVPEWAKIRGNRICSCESGKKFRYCHGKGLKPYL